MSKVPSWLDHLASLKLTIICLALMMGLVLVGTLAQVQMGTLAAQQRFFNSLFLYLDVAGAKVPVFLGGMSIGGLWLINLVAAYIVRFRWEGKKMGIYISHAGLILLVAGQGFTQLMARESSMPLQAGESRNYSESTQQVELAVINRSPSDYDEVTSIPLSFFNHEGILHAPRLPFSFVIRHFYPNAVLSMAAPGAAPEATQGIGTRVSVQEAPLVTSDDEMNNTTALIEVLDGTRSLGVWLVSSGLGAPQSFNAGGNEYQIFIRPKRFYFPFTLTLKEFHHDIYPGTEIPKNFSSLVHLAKPEARESRDALIYMNHPLRYEGRTFYQASFGEGDRVSILQVVQNPVSPSPYIACAMVVLGLAIQFLSHLLAFLGKRS
jgi:hypothetical protein